MGIAVSRGGAPTARGVSCCQSYGDEVGQDWQGPNRSSSRETEKLLATDQERDEAIETLGRALTSGQLTVDEYEERVGAILEARTRREIEDQLKDIGSPSGAPARRKVRPGFIVTGVAVLGLGLATASLMAFGGSNWCSQTPPGLSV